MSTMKTTTKGPKVALVLAHILTPTCNAAPGAHWTAHSLACRTEAAKLGVHGAAVARKVVA